MLIFPHAKFQDSRINIKKKYATFSINLTNNLVSDDKLKNNLDKDIPCNGERQENRKRV